MYAIRLASCPTVPWKNGGGGTREVAQGDGWRISVATIDRDGPFSDFTGFDRTIVPIEGAGFTLDFDDGSNVRLDRLYVPFRFAGEKKIACRLIEGTSRDLNVMTQRARWSHDARTIRSSAPAETLEVSAPAFFFVAAGDVWATSATESAALAPGDTLVCDADARVEFSGTAIALIEIVLRATG